MFWQVHSNDSLNPSSRHLRAIVSKLLPVLRLKGCFVMVKVTIGGRVINRPYITGSTPFISLYDPATIDPPTPMRSRLKACATLWFHRNIKFGMRELISSTKKGEGGDGERNERGGPSMGWEGGQDNERGGFLEW